MLLPVSVIRPETTTLTRLLTLACLLGLGSLPLVLAWNVKPLRFVLLGLVALCGVVLALPGRGTDGLREAYVRALRTYEGDHYVWGGENHRGIDCSGLVRRAMVDANLHQGLTRLDGAALRRALELWLFDASASALGQQYRGWTRELFRAPSLVAADDSRLVPGDLAVTQDGLHVLVYLGDRKWIQADPVPMRVHADVVEPKGWFTHPVVLLRWVALN